MPALFLSVGFVVSRMVPNFRAMQARIDEVNRVLREQITGIRVVRAFVREPHEAQRFGTANDDLTEVAVRAGRWMATMFPLVMLVVNVSSVAVIWFGGHRVDNGQMQIGALTAFLSYLMQILMSVMMATFMLMMVPRAAVCGDRITEVLDTAHVVVPPPPSPVAARPERARLARPRGRHVLLPGCRAAGAPRRLAVRAGPGQTVAVIGSTGAGKSTLVNLVPRLFDATAGTVRVDGVDVRELDPELLWSQIGLVPQKAYLFTGTVRSNLLHGKPDATDEELWAALEVAQARDFVEAHARGPRRPGRPGRHQLLRRPAAAARDRAGARTPAGDLPVRRLVLGARPGHRRPAARGAATRDDRDATVVIVAQRVSTICDADLILVLEDGRVVGRGTHHELLDDCATYQEIVTSQLTAEEAA